MCRYGRVEDDSDGAHGGGWRTVPPMGARRRRPVVRRFAALALCGVLVVQMTDAAAQDGGEVVPQPGLLAVLDGTFSSERVTLVDTSGRVVVDLGAAEWAEWSADGALIAYQQVDRKDTVPVARRLVVAASDGADPVVVAEGPRWAWSPSEDQLFTTEWDSLTETTTTYVVNSDGPKTDRGR